MATEAKNVAFFACFCSFGSLKTLFPVSNIIFCAYVVYVFTKVDPLVVHMANEKQKKGSFLQKWATLTNFGQNLVFLAKNGQLLAKISQTALDDFSSVGNFVPKKPKK